MLILWYFGLASLNRVKGISKGVLLFAALLPLPFVGLVVYAEGSYMVLDEGLMEAGCEGDVSRIERLIAWGADPNKPDANEGYALSCAVENGHVEATRVLLRHGADPNRSGHFDSVKQEAAKSDDPAIRRLFGLPPKVKP